MRVEINLRYLLWGIVLLGVAVTVWLVLLGPAALLLLRPTP